MQSRDDRADFQAYGAEKWVNDPEVSGLEPLQMRSDPTLLRTKVLYLNSWSNSAHHAFREFFLQL
jgi:hypothetical protein